MQDQPFQTPLHLLPWSLGALTEEVRRAYFPSMKQVLHVEFVSGSAPLACISVPGSFDIAFIALHSALNRPDTPEAVLRYLLTHELLHVDYPNEAPKGRRRRKHTKAFWEQEALLCPDRAECSRWIHSNVGYALVHRERYDGTWVIPRSARQRRWSIAKPTASDRPRSTSVA